jgi:transcriptional regulator with XRE-family HTH domain
MMLDRRMTTFEPSDPSGFPATLRAWRQARGMSQFDLAETVGVSTRHLSFLETGRAKPSRQMALALAEGVMAPLAARNALLTQAGFAPIYPTTPLDSAALAPLRAILSEMMAKHAPYPAMMCDRHWTVHEATPSAHALLGALRGAGTEMNVVRLLTDSPTAPDFVVNYGEALAEMHARIRLEALEAGHDPVLEDLLARLAQRQKAYPAPSDLARRALAPLTMRGPAGELRFLTTIAHFGTSEDVTVRDLRLELLFPMDEATKAAMGDFKT